MKFIIYFNTSCYENSEIVEALKLVEKTGYKLVHFLTTVSKNFILMLPTNFYLTPTETGGIIRDIKSMLRINIHNLDVAVFQPNPSELQFYSICPEGYLAFETVNVKDYLRPLIAPALLWYAGFIGYPDMDISSLDPRNTLKAV
jgi:hypothetical protein